MYDGGSNYKSNICACIVHAVPNFNRESDNDKIPNEATRSQLEVREDVKKLIEIISYVWVVKVCTKFVL